MTNYSAAVGSGHDERSGVQELSDWAQLTNLRDELAVFEGWVEKLEAALINARKIGAAIGIVMSTRKLSYEESFGFLSSVSQREREAQQRGRAGADHWLRSAVASLSCCVRS